MLCFSSTQHNIYQHLQLVKTIITYTWLYYSKRLNLYVSLIEFFVIQQLQFHKTETYTLKIIVIEHSIKYRTKQSFNLFQIDNHIIQSILQFVIVQRNIHCSIFDLKKTMKRLVGTCWIVLNIFIELKLPKSSTKDLTKTLLDYYRTKFGN